MPTRRFSRLTVSLLIGALGCALSLGGITAVHAEEFSVVAGQSIQAQINAAPPGSTITIAAGTYRENLVISKDNITLKGAGTRSTIVIPSTTPTPNSCEPGLVVGICVNNPGGRINRVTIQSLFVKGFSGSGIALQGVDSPIVNTVSSESNGGSGIKAASVKAPKVTTAILHHNRAAGLAILESGRTNAQVGQVFAQNNRWGMLVRNTSLGTVAVADLHHNCAGAELLNTGSGVKHWRFLHVQFRDNTKACPASDLGAALSGNGLTLAGASQNEIFHNFVDRNFPTGPSVYQGGVLLVSTSSIGGSNASENWIHGNRILNNSPYDLIDRSGGNTNFISDNAIYNFFCGTSQPAGACTQSPQYQYRPPAWYLNGANWTP